MLLFGPRRVFQKLLQQILVLIKINEFNCFHLFVVNLEFWEIINVQLLYLEPTQIGERNGHIAMRHNLLQDF